MELNQINKEIKEIKEKPLELKNFIRIMNLLEYKIIFSSKYKDLRHYSKYISRLNLSEEDTNQLLDLRNRAVHGALKEVEIKKYRNWLNSIIIPAILAYKEESSFTFNEDFIVHQVLEKIKILERELNCQITLEKSFTYGHRRIRPDIVIEKNNKKIFVEVKTYLFDDAERVKLMGLAQLKEYLILSDEKLGILILHGDIYQELEEVEYNILIFGQNLNFNKLLNWVKLKFKDLRN